MTDTFHIWYIDLSCWEEEPYCFWWRSKVIWGHQRSKTENLVIAIYQDRNGWYRFVMLRERTLSFLVEVKGHLMSPEVKLRKPRKRLVNTISRDSNDRHISYLVYRYIMLRGRSLLFLVKVKGHLRSPAEKLVIAISRDRSDGNFSYLVYRFVMLRGRTLKFLAKVKGHLRSAEVKSQKARNRDIWRQEWPALFIFGI